MYIYIYISSSLQFPKPERPDRFAPHSSSQSSHGTSELHPEQREQGQVAVCRQLGSGGAGQPAGRVQPVARGRSGSPGEVRRALLEDPISGILLG